MPYVPRSVSEPNIASLKSVKFVLGAFCKGAEASFWQLSILSCTGFLTAIGQLPLVASKNVSDSSFMRASLRNLELCISPQLPTKSP